MDYNVCTCWGSRLESVNGMRDTLSQVSMHPRRCERPPSATWPALAFAIAAFMASFPSSALGARLVDAAVAAWETHLLRLDFGEGLQMSCFGADDCLSKVY